MAESKTVTIVPLKGENYPTWKVQCRMALVRDGLWGIVSGTETAPSGDRAKFLATVTAVLDRRSRRPSCRVAKLQNQFQKVGPIS